ncbi:hypothetical protein B0H13DRAFT_1856049 [Mycena leptocephala]|nr:hypothetical protein B0H13DRAFT_1856049 [Mycena leptocephala]
MYFSMLSCSFLLILLRSGLWAAPLNPLPIGPREVVSIDQLPVYGLHAPKRIRQKILEPSTRLQGLQIHAPNLPGTSRFPPLAAASGTPRFTLSPGARVLVATKSRPAASPHLIHTDRVSVNQALEALDVQMGLNHSGLTLLEVP